MATLEQPDRASAPVNDLLLELDELRALDRRRHVHAPGSVAHDMASADIDRRSRNLMDRCRDLPDNIDSSLRVPTPDSPEVVGPH